jgi:hypothetical protein
VRRLRAAISRRVARCIEIVGGATFAERRLMQGDGRAVRKPAEEQRAGAGQPLPRSGEPERIRKRRDIPPEPADVLREFSVNDVAPQAERTVAERVHDAGYAERCRGVVQRATSPRSNSSLKKSGWLSPSV